MRAIAILARFTFRESIRHRWVVWFGAAFAILAFLLSLVGSGEINSLSDFDKTAAMLLNILLLFVPLLGITLGAQLIAADRESGALVYLMSQPISKWDLFIGKTIGASVALIVSVSIGFALAGIGIAISGGGSVWGFVVLWLGAAFFSGVCLSIGLLVSVLTASRSRSIAVALMTWFIFTILSDLGLMGTAYVLRLRSEGIVGMAILNPVEAFKILAVRLLSSNLELLGSGGVYLDYLFGNRLPALLVAWLALMVAFALGIAYWMFFNQEEA